MPEKPQKEEIFLVTETFASADEDTRRENLQKAVDRYLVAALKTQDAEAL